MVLLCKLSIQPTGHLRNNIPNSLAKLANNSQLWCAKLRVFATKLVLYSTLVTCPEEIVVQDALESALDAEIDQYRDILRDGKPKTALGLYHALLARVQGTASSRIIFRIKANIGHCQMVLGDNVRAAHWLLEPLPHAPKEPKTLANKALAMLLQNRFKEAYEFAYSELRKDPTNQWLAPYLIQAIVRCEDLDDPISKIPDQLREQADVQAAYVNFLRYRDRTPDWWIAAKRASAAHPDHKALLECRAEADLDEIGRGGDQRGARLSTEVKATIKFAAKILRELWDTRRLSEIQHCQITLVHAAIFWLHIHSWAK